MPTAKLKQDAKLVTLLRNAVEAAKGENGWARVGAVGQQIGNQASFDPRNYGYATLSKLLKATDLFQLDKEGTSEVAVRDVRPARAGKGLKTETKERPLGPLLRPPVAAGDRRGLTSSPARRPAWRLRLRA